MSTSEPGRVRVVCVDDNMLVVDALRRRIAQEGGLEWAGYVSDSARIAADLRRLLPDVVLMDIDMPGLDTFAEVERLTREAPEMRVVMFSGHVRLDYIDRALDAGAWGYLSKNEDTSRLIRAISDVSRGLIVLSPEVEAVQRAAAP